MSTLPTTLSICWCSCVSSLSFSVLCLWYICGCAKELTVIIVLISCHHIWGMHWLVCQLDANTVHYFLSFENISSFRPKTVLLSIIKTKACFWCVFSVDVMPVHVLNKWVPLRSLLLMIYIIVIQEVLPYDAILIIFFWFMSIVANHISAVHTTLRTVSHSLILIIVCLDLCDTSIAFLDNASVPMGKPYNDNRVRTESLI